MEAGDFAEPVSAISVVSRGYRYRSCEGDIDVDLEADVDSDSYFGCLKGGLKVSAGVV